MTALAISLENASPSGAKLYIGHSVDGGAKRTMYFEADEIRQSLSTEEREVFLRLLLKGALAGLTRAQARTKMQTGFAVTL